MNLIEAMAIVEAGGIVHAVGRKCFIRASTGPEPELEWSLTGDPCSIWTPWSPWPVDFRGEYEATR